MSGLELGPLNRPRIRPEAGDVRYVDCFSTQELRDTYSANSATRDVLEEIVDVHYVVRREQSVSEVAGRDAPFDYVLASHVIEHVANPIGWLRDLQSILGDGGVLSLVVPDRRFCFDVNRANTRSQDWIDWYLRDLRSPGPGQIFDFFAHVTTIDGTVDTTGLWAGTADYAGVRRTDVADPDRSAFDVCKQYLESGKHIDVHVGTYTPAVLLDLLELTFKLGLIDFEIAEFVSTAPNTLEFFLTLRKLPPGNGHAALRSVTRAREILSCSPAPALSARRPDGHIGVEHPSGAPALLSVSPAELRLLQLKRSVMTTLRGAQRAVRNRI
jgi:hypothetical protein